MGESDSETKPDISIRHSEDELRIRINGNGHKRIVVETEKELFEIPPTSLTDGQVIINYSKKNGKGSEKLSNGIETNQYTLNSDGTINPYLNLTEDDIERVLKRGGLIEKKLVRKLRKNRKDTMYKMFNTFLQHINEEKGFPSTKEIETKSSINYQTIRSTHSILEDIGGITYHKEGKTKFVEYNVLLGA